MPAKKWIFTAARKASLKKAQAAAAAMRKKGTKTATKAVTKRKTPIEMAREVGRKTRAKRAGKGNPDMMTSMERATGVTAAEANRRLFREAARKAGRYPKY